MKVTAQMDDGKVQIYIGVYFIDIEHKKFGNLIQF